MSSQAEQKVQSTIQSPNPALNKPLPSVPDRIQIEGVDRRPTNPLRHEKPHEDDSCPDSRRKGSQRGRPSIRNNCKLPRKAIEAVLSLLLLLLQWLDTLPAVAVVFMVPSASAQATDDTEPERTRGQFEWVPMLCSVMVLAGSALAIWLPYSTLMPMQRRRCSNLCGFLSLVVGGAWSVIFFTVDINDDRRYLALGFWSMVTVPFITESYRSARNQRRYAVLVGPTFLAVLKPAFWLFPRLTGSGAVRWTSPDTYEGVPGLFASWAIFSWWMRNKSAPVVDPRGGGDNNNTAGAFPAVGGGGDGGADVENQVGSMSGS
jgi:hypothetical protein